MSDLASKTTALRRALDAANLAAWAWDYAGLDRIMGGIKATLKQEISNEVLA